MTEVLMMTLTPQLRKIAKREHLILPQFENQT